MQVDGAGTGACGRDRYRWQEQVQVDGAVACGRWQEQVHVAGAPDGEAKVLAGRVGGLEDR